MKEIKIIIDGKEYELKKVKKKEKKKEWRNDWEAGYWFFDRYVIACKASDLSPEIAQQDHKNGNRFETKEAIEKELEKRRAIVTIKDYISDTWGEFIPDWRNADRTKYYVRYDARFVHFVTDYYYTTIVYSPIGHLECNSHPKEIIKKFEEELKLIFEVK